MCTFQPQRCGVQIQTSLKYKNIDVFIYLVINLRVFLLVITLASYGHVSTSEVWYSNIINSKIQKYQCIYIFNDKLKGIFVSRYISIIWICFNLRCGIQI